MYRFWNASSASLLRVVPSPQVKAEQAFDFGEAGDRKQYKPEPTEHRQAKVDVDIGKQLALDRDLPLQELQRAQGGITRTSSVAGDQPGVLRQRRLHRWIQPVGDVNQPGRVERHAAIEDNGCIRDTQGISQLPHEKIGGVDLAHTGQCCLPGSHVGCTQQNRPQRKSLQENYRAQHNPRSIGRPDIKECDAGRNQQQHSEADNATAAPAGHEHLQRQDQPGAQSGGVHGYEFTGLKGVVVLDVTQILRNNVQACSHDGAEDHDDRERSPQRYLAPHGAEVQNGVRIFGAAVPPQEERKEDNSTDQASVNKGRLKPQVALSTAHGNLKQHEGRYQKARATKIQTGSLAAPIEFSWRQEPPDQNGADDEKRKVQQKRRIPVKRIIDRSHQHGVTNLKSK